MFIFISVLPIEAIWRLKFRMNSIVAYLVHFFISGHHVLTHWGRETHIFGTSLFQIMACHLLISHQGFIGTSSCLLSIGSLGTILSEIRIQMQHNKMKLKISSTKWRLFNIGLNVLNAWSNQRVISITNTFDQYGTIWKEIRHLSLYIMNETQRSASCLNIEPLDRIRLVKIRFCPHDSFRNNIWCGGCTTRVGKPLAVHSILMWNSTYITIVCVPLNGIVNIHYQRFEK